MSSSSLTLRSEIEGGWYPWYDFGEALRGLGSTFRDTTAATVAFRKVYIEATGGYRRRDRRAWLRTLLYRPVPAKAAHRRRYGR